MTVRRSLADNTAPDHLYKFTVKVHFRTTFESWNNFCSNIYWNIVVFSTKKTLNCPMAQIHGKFTEQGSKSQAFTHDTWVKILHRGGSENHWIPCKIHWSDNTVKQPNCMSQRSKTPKNTILPLTIHTKVSETVDQAKTLDVNRA